MSKWHTIVFCLCRVSEQCILLIYASNAFLLNLNFAKSRISVVSEQCILLLLNRVVRCCRIIEFYHMVFSPEPCILIFTESDFISPESCSVVAESCISIYESWIYLVAKSSVSVCC